MGIACAYCEKKLIGPQHGNRKFCSHLCAQKSWRAANPNHGVIRRGSSLARNCATCGRIFWAKSDKGRFCSYICTNTQLGRRLLRGRQCLCGAYLNHRNRTGVCPRCSNAEGRRQLRRRSELSDSYVKKLIVDANPSMRGRIIVSKDMLEAKRLLVMVRRKIAEVQRDKIAKRSAS